MTLTPQQPAVTLTFDLQSSPESNQVISSRGCWQQQKTKDEGGGYKYLSATWVECLKRAVVHHGVFSKLRVPIL